MSAFEKDFHEPVEPNAVTRLLIKLRDLMIRMGPLWTFIAWHAVGLAFSSAWVWMDYMHACAIQIWGHQYTIDASFYFFILTLMLWDMIGVFGYLSIFRKSVTKGTRHMLLAVLIGCLSGAALVAIAQHVISGISNVQDNSISYNNTEVDMGLLGAFILILAATPFLPSLIMHVGNSFCDSNSNGT